LGVKLLLLILVSQSTLGDGLPRSPRVKVEAVDGQTLYVTSKEKIENTWVSNYSHMVASACQLEKPLNTFAISVYGKQNPLEVFVITTVPNTKGLQRRYTIIVDNPAMSVRQ
jgi:hypothetical protein